VVDLEQDRAVALNHRGTMWVHEDCDSQPRS
jgi:hypothetical protein